MIAPGLPWHCHHSKLGHWHRIVGHDLDLQTAFWWHKEAKFWICASRELCGVMLSMNMCCEIILIALQQSLLSDSHHMINENQNRKISQALQSIQNLSSKNPVWILLIIILKQSTELRSIQSLCEQIHPACCSLPCYNSNQRNIMFFHGKLH